MEEYDKWANVEDVSAMKIIANYMRIYIIIYLIVCVRISKEVVYCRWYSDAPP